MRPPESFIAQPIRSLQTMLRVIAQVEPSQPSVIPDGIYDEYTQRAVSAFQRRMGLPVTGVVDNGTWDLIVEEYQKAQVETGPAYPVQITLNPGQVIRRGEQSPYMALIQAMLMLLAEVYPTFPEVEVTGVLDWDTQQALLALQLQSGLALTGELDKQTWKHLALQFSQAADQLQNREKTVNYL